MTEETKPENAPQINVDDIKIAANIIEIATTRGAFRANELALIGTTYNKLIAFLASVKAPSATQEPATDLPKDGD